jgi:hypothetical protein
MTLSSSLSWGQLNLSDPQVKHDVAQKLIDLKVCSANNVTLQNAYNDCANNKHGAVQFWQKPEFVLAGFTVSFGVGALFAASHCFGLCK